MVNTAVKTIFVAQVSLFAAVTYIALTSTGLGIVFALIPIAAAGVLYVGNLVCLTLLIAKSTRTPEDVRARTLSVAMVALPLPYLGLNHLTVN